MDPQQLAVVVSLVAVLSSSVIALVSLWSNQRLHQQSSQREFALQLLPDRLRSIELAWRVLFTLEAEEPITDVMLDDLIRSSIWLPSRVRRTVLASVGSPNGVDYGKVRASLEEAAGVELIANLMDQMNTP